VGAPQVHNRSRPSEAPVTLGPMSDWEIPQADPSDIYLKRLRELEPQAEKRIRNQHVVSKVILKGFAAPGPHGAGWRLTPFDLHLGHEQKPRGLDGCGKVPDFLKFASESAEQLWKGVEDQLHTAIGTARAGHLHDQSAHVEAIMDGVALHLVRSLRYLELHRAIVAQSIEDVRRTALHSRRATLQAEFQRRHGLMAAGNEALATVLEEPISKWRALDARGAIARASMEAMFRRARVAVRSGAVEVWHVPPRYELLISDSPAFTFRYLRDDTSIQLNVAIGDCNAIAMPLARDCLVVIGSKATDDELLPDQVSFFNRLQVEVGHRHVYYRPRSGLKTFVQAML
jgi:hypothetical protein